MPHPSGKMRTKQGGPQENERVSPCENPVPSVFREFDFDFDFAEDETPKTKRPPEGGPNL
jgi:hypothetical protein